MSNIIKFKPPDCEKLVMFTLVSSFDGMEFSHWIEAPLLDDKNSYDVQIIVNHLRRIADQMEKNRNKKERRNNE